tara:strand:+ start:2055 stop:2420 length:366 start_codon:yes stop_codon:yes gene_type:complete
MSDEQNSENEHHEHSFPALLYGGDNPIEGFMRVFAWLVFFTIIEVMAILQEFSFWATMAILFGIAAIKVWFIGAFFMHMIWDPPLVNRTAAVPVFFLLVLFVAIGLTTPGAVDDLKTICGF